MMATHPLSVLQSQAQRRSTEMVVWRAVWMLGDGVDEIDEIVAHVRQAARDIAVHLVRVEVIQRHVIVELHLEPSIEGESAAIALRSAASERLVRARGNLAGGWWRAGIFLTRL